MSNVIEGLTAERITTVTETLSNIVANLSGHTKTKRGALELGEHMKNALGLIYDLVKASEDQQKQLVSLKTDDPRYSSASAADFQDKVNKALEDLNTLGSQGWLDDPTRRIVHDVYALVRAMDSRGNMIYVADIRPMKGLPAYTELMAWFDGHIRTLTLNQDPNAPYVREVFNEMVGQLKTITGLEHRISGMDDNREGLEKQIRDLEMNLEAVTSVKDSVNTEANDLRIRLTAAEGIIRDKDYEVSNIRGLVTQREQELASARRQLNEALQGRDNAERTAEDTKFKHAELPVLSIEQPGGSSGFWVIDREWHDWAVQERLLNLRGTTEDRHTYEGLLRNAVVALARKSGLNKDLNEVFCKIVLVDWDDFFNNEADGPSRFGPVFSAGTLKLLEDGVTATKPTEPEKPKVPAILALQQPQASRKVWAVSDEFLNWFKEELPLLGNPSSLAGRNGLRTRMAELVNEMLGLGLNAKLPVLVIDWDMSPAGVLYFVTPEIDLTPFIQPQKVNHY